MDAHTQHATWLEPPPMKAIIQSRYGSPEGLELETVSEPEPGAGEVLLQVKAASLNAADVECLSGRSIVRLAGPWRPPHRIPGSDVAGVVAALGPDVDRFSVGDEVFGDLFSHGFGAFAERVVAPIAALALKPADLSFEQVATLPQAGVLAWQGLRDGRTTQPGDRILISGAGGGVGSFAIQLAVSMGAEVTAVDRVGKRAFIESLGASHFIDFEAQDYVNSDVRYDTIIDVQARRSVRAIRRVLAPSGRYGVVGGPFPRIMEAFVMGQVASRTGSQSIGVVVWRANDPEITTSLVDAIRDGSMRPAIGQVYPLEDAAQAFRHLASGTLHGKAVISVA